MLHAVLHPNKSCRVPRQGRGEGARELEPLSQKPSCVRNMISHVSGSLSVAIKLQIYSIYI